MRFNKFVQMPFAQVTNCRAGKGIGKFSQLNLSVVSIFGGELRPLAFTSFGARFLRRNEFLDRFSNLLAFQACNCGQVACHGFSQSDIQLGSSLAILGYASQQRPWRTSGCSWDSA